MCVELPLAVAIFGHCRHAPFDLQMDAHQHASGPGIFERCRQRRRPDDSTLSQMV